jgi:hypothetical protein
MCRTWSVVSCLAVCCVLASTAWAGAAAAKPPALASFDWSVNAAHNLAANPPTPDLVWKLINSASGNESGHLCGFRFADLRHSGNFSLVMSVDGGGTGGCSETIIFDKRKSGFEIHSSWASFSSDDGIQDINHDGKLELILWGPIGPGPDRLGEQCYWPMVFAWTGNGYSEVSREYKRYYEQHLKILQEQIASEPSAEATPGSAALGMPARQPLVVPGVFQFGGGTSAPSSTSQAGSGGVALVPSPVASATAAPMSQADYDCDRIEAAKTEAFLGIRSDVTMSYAVKASESNNPYQRKLAAVLFSFVGTPEATTDLKELANDSDRGVAEAAKDRVSAGQEPDSYYRQISAEPFFRWWPVPNR